MRNQTNKKEMSLYNFHTKTEIGQKMLAAHTEKQKRLSTWLSKLNASELAEYNAGMNDQRRYELRKKYNY